MIWFERLFPLVMVLWPAAVLACVRPLPGKVRPDAAVLARRAWLGTLAAVVVVGLCQWAAEAGLDGTPVLAHGWRVAVPLTFSFLLWFRLCMPALRARHPGWGDPTARTTGQRSASLTPRHVRPELPGWAWVLGALIWVASSVVLVRAVVADAASPALLVALLPYPGFALGARQVRAEAEPRDAADSPELVAAYASLRRFRAWSFWWVGVLMTLAFAAMALSLHHSWLDSGVLGAVLGAGVGLLGAFLGCVASVRRARVNALLAELESAEGQGC